MSGTKMDYTPLGGGLNYMSGALNAEPGSLLECLNFEQVFGIQGYRRIDGYERFDGRTEPHTAQFFLMGFSSGAVEITAGSIVEGAGASAEVLAVELQSGAWDGTAAGRIAVILPVGTFVLDEALKVGATTVATVSSLPELGDIDEPRRNEFLALAREALRDSITAVPGSGPVLGVAVYQGDVYAVRNAADGKTAVLHKSSPLGWTAVRTGLLPGGEWRFNVSNFSGLPSGLSLYGVDGKNDMFQWDGTTFTYPAPIYGSQATSTTSLAIGTGSKAFVIAQSGRSWAVNDVLLAYSAADAGKRMVGTVVSYSSGTLTLNVTDSLGTGSAADWMICRADFVDKPYLVMDHRDHMFLAYPKGQLQTSNLGDPMTYTTTAAAFGVGDEITGLVPMRGAVLGVFCLNRITVLSGTTSINWSLEAYSRSAGARHDSVQEVLGSAVFLDDRGLTSLQATQNFGDFEPSIFSREIRPLVDAYTRRIICSRVAKTKFQYRLYTDDGLRITAAFLTPNAAVTPSDVVFTTQRYLHQPTCVGYGDMLDGSDGMFFGTSDGFVMREDVGTSFDGQEIYGLLKLHFNHLKSPASKKRYRKLDIELDSPGRIELSFRQRFDYADGEYATGESSPVESLGRGAAWDASQWDRFYWSLPSSTRVEANIDGVGRNMGLMVYHVSSFDEPFTLQGVLLQYTPLGIKR